MALLVLFPAAAWARIVPPDLGLLAAHGFDDIVATHSGRLWLACSRRGSRSTSPKPSYGLGGIVENERRPARRCHGPRSRPPRRSDAWADARLAAFGQNRPQRPEIADRVLVDAILHRLEHLEAFFL